MPDQNIRMARISVVIPAHNRAHTIARAIRSVLAQSRSIHEIFVVDDGSTDRLADALRDFSTVQLVTLAKRSGAPNARNVGADMSTGELIAFLDSDDAWHPQKLELQASLLDHFPESPGAFTGVREVKSEDDTNVSTYIPPAEVTLDQLAYSNVLGTVSTCLVRRSAFVECGGFDTRLPSCQDWDLWYRLAKVGKLLTVQSALVDFYQDTSGRISKNPDNVLRGHEIMFSNILRSVALADVRGVRSAHYSRISNIYSRDIPRLLPAINAALRAFLCKPTRSSAAQIARVAHRLLISRN